jgi:peptidoglycan/LPS O-acetylase OafA/YrhL
MNQHPVNLGSSTFRDSKGHYKTLDGLRGVAALMVVMFHIFEIFSGGDHRKQIINHGYLSVDFFFVLSGFVIGYAYDDRWNKMRLGDFFKRRLIRLHPMIIIGMLLGAITFYFQASPLFPGIHEVPVWKLFLILFIGFTLVPVPPSMDIRGWGEMHPLNGPAWSLFFEYIANILYAVLVRRFSNTVLAILVFLAGAALIHLGITSPQGDLVGGWSIEWSQFRIGLTRLLYPFFAGLLLSRISKPGKIKHAFLLCSFLLIATLAIPRVSSHLWINGLYDALAVIFIFPLIVYLGASGETKENISSRISKFLGDISFPLYIVHYPVIYLFMAWVVTSEPSTMEAIIAGVIVLMISILLAYACVKFYDIPVRKWLTRRFMGSVVK